MNYNITNITVTNCYFDNGIFHTYYNATSSLSIENSYFQNNFGYRGAVFFIEYVRYDYDNDIIISNSIFENNNAKEYGGVIYVQNRLFSSENSSRVLFKDCEFRNNTAKKGNNK